MSDPARILIIRPSALGDVCRSVHVAASLRAAFPEAHIAWLVQRGFEGAVQAHPAVNEVIAFARREMARPWRTRDRRALWAFVADLRGRRFDLVVDAQGLARSGLIALATGARARIGFAAAREGAWLAYSRRVPAPADGHAVDRMQALAVAAGGGPAVDLRLTVPPEDAAWWERTRPWPSGRPAVVLAPTARWRCKQWPAERFAALARRQLAAGRHVVLVGAPGEESAVAAARPPEAPVAGDSGDAGVDVAGVLDLAGRTRVGQMMAVLAGVSVVVAGDSAALHMASGLGVPTVALFGPTDPRLVGPRGGPTTVLRHVDPAEDPIRYRRLRDDDRYMQRIEIDEVAAAVEAAFRPAGEDDA